MYVNFMKDFEICELFSFLDSSTCSFFAVKNVCQILRSNGFVQLFENEKWSLGSGKYFVVRNDSSVISFVVPEKKAEGFLIASSHSDSPCFKIKENPEISKSAVTVLNVEKYGGSLLNPWFDRPLGICGRVVVETAEGVKSLLVDFEKDMVLIPNLAIHFNRDANEGHKIHVQNEMLPVVSSHKDFKLKKEVASKLNTAEKDILAMDLFVYSREKSTQWGSDGEFFSAPRIDDLECVWTTLQGFVNSENDKYITVHAVFDNEEVGSLTAQGADSTFLSDILKRINFSLKGDEEDYNCLVAGSFMVSADNAHGVHPNFSGSSDPVNGPKLNGGPVIKFNGNQKYTSDGISAALFKKICRKAGVDFQIFTNNSNIAGGSTLGNISNSHVSLRCVDIGLAQWAMHSPFESAGSKDPEMMIKVIKEFYCSEINVK